MFQGTSPLWELMVTDTVAKGNGMPSIPFLLVISDGKSPGLLIWRLPWHLLHLPVSSSGFLCFSYSLDAEEWTKADQVLGKAGGPPGR